MSFHTLRWSAAAVLAMSCSLPALAQVAVVVAPNSPLASMSAEQVASLFLGKSPAVLADLPEASPVREQFYTKVAGKTPAQVKAVWARLTFSGKGIPPKELATAAEVKKFVAANPEAVGYIEKAAVDGSVKVVLEVN